MNLHRRRGGMGLNFALSWQRLSFWSSLSTLGTNFAQIFRIFSSSRIILVYSSHDDIKECTYCFYRHTTVLIHEILFWPLNSGVLTSLLLLHLSSSLTDSLPSLNFLCHSKTDARFMQDAPKAVSSIAYVSLAFFPSLKHNFIAHRSSKVSSRPDCIFEVHQLWQSGFSRVYSNVAVNLILKT